VVGIGFMVNPLRLVRVYLRAIRPMGPNHCTLQVASPRSNDFDLENGVWCKIKIEFYSNTI